MQLYVGSAAETGSALGVATNQLSVGPASSIQLHTEPRPPKHPYKGTVRADGFLASYHANADTLVRMYADPDLFVPGFYVAVDGHHCYLILFFRSCRYVGCNSPMARQLLMPVACMTYLFQGTFWGVAFVNSFL